MGECLGGEGGRGENYLHGEKSPREGRGRKREAFKGSGEEGGYFNGEGGRGGEQG